MDLIRTDDLLANLARALDEAHVVAEVVVDYHRPKKRFTNLKDLAADIQSGLDSATTHFVAIEPELKSVERLLADISSGNPAKINAATMGLHDQLPKLADTLNIIGGAAEVFAVRSVPHYLKALVFWSKNWARNASTDELPDELPAHDAPVRSPGRATQTTPGQRPKTAPLSAGYGRSSAGSLGASSAFLKGAK